MTATVATLESTVRLQVEEAREESVPLAGDTTVWGEGRYYYGYRDYSPMAMRFTTTDPVRSGANWYAYVNGDPVNYVDPWGLSPSDSVVAAAGEVPYVGGFLGPIPSPTITIGAAATLGPVIGVAVAAAVVVTTTVLADAERRVQETIRKDIEEGFSDLDDQQVYYRGLSATDVREYEETGNILSYAARAGIDPTQDTDFEELAKQHAEDSQHPPSGYVGVTTNRELATAFAVSQPDPGYAVAIISTERAVPNPANTAEDEYLIKGAVVRSEILSVQYLRN